MGGIDEDRAGGGVPDGCVVVCGIARHVGHTGMVEMQTIDRRVGKHDGEKVGQSSDQPIERGPTLLGGANTSHIKQASK